jgi:predicted DNA-binding transcriptional regulator AlpA
MEAILERIELLLIALLEVLKRNEAAAPPRQEPVPAVADEWLRGDQVMAILSISQRTLYNYYLSGAFKTRRFGGTRFYSKESVMGMK